MTRVGFGNYFCADDSGHFEVSLKLYIAGSTESYWSNSPSIWRPKLP